MCNLKSLIMSECFLANEVHEHVPGIPVLGRIKRSYGKLVLNVEEVILAVQVGRQPSYCGQQII